MTVTEREIAQAVRWLNQQASTISHGSVGVTFIMHAGAVVLAQDCRFSKMIRGLDPETGEITAERVQKWIKEHPAKRKLTEQDVRDFCKGKISRFKIPRYVFFVTSFPMTASGKIQKYKLKEIGVALLKESGVEIV